MNATRRRGLRIAELQDRLDALEQRHAVQWEDPVVLLERAAVLLEDDATRPHERWARAIALIDQVLEDELQPP